MGGSWQAARGPSAPLKSEGSERRGEGSNEVGGGLCEGRGIVDGDVTVAVVVGFGEFPVDLDGGVGVRGCLSRSSLAFLRA